jgi:hypothetical protein
MTVYVVQESPKFNLLPAADYGDLQTLLPPGQVMMATAPTIRILRDKLRSFSDSDYLLAIGDPIAIGMSVAIAAGFNGGKIRMLTMIDEFTRKCLTIHCARRIGSIQVIEQLANAMIDNGIPEYIRSDNGPEFIAKELRSWLSGIGVKTAYIEPGSPWENGFCESFNGTFRDNLLDGEIFYSLKEAQIIVGEWVKHYNHVRPHSALGYRPPAPQVQIPKIIQTQPILLQ